MNDTQINRMLTILSGIQKELASLNKSVKHLNQVKFNISEELSPELDTSIREIMNDVLKDK